MSHQTDTKLARAVVVAMTRRSSHGLDLQCAAAKATNQDDMFGWGGRRRLITHIENVSMGSMSDWLRRQAALPGDLAPDERSPGWKAVDPPTTAVVRGVAPG